jgi:hypothetical protein
VPNLQIVNRSAHVEKCAQESGEPAQRRSARDRGIVASGTEAVAAAKP